MIWNINYILENVYAVAPLAAALRDRHDCSHLLDKEMMTEEVKALLYDQTEAGGRGKIPCQASGALTCIPLLLFPLDWVPHECYGLKESRRAEGWEKTLQNKCVMRKIASVSLKLLVFVFLLCLA